MKYFTWYCRPSCIKFLSHVDWNRADFVTGFRI